MIRTCEGVEAGGGAVEWIKRQSQRGRRKGMPASKLKKVPHHCDIGFHLKRMKVLI